MEPFRIFYTGDYLNLEGKLTVPSLEAEVFEGKPWIRYDFLRDQSPQPGEASYWDRLYSIEVQPHHVQEAHAIVIFRPWVKASTFAQGAGKLVVIGRAGAGYDKLNLDACTANDVVVFNCPDTLTHSTASAAFLFILALAKRLPGQEDILRRARWDLQPLVQGDDLPGKTLGIVGLGATGRELARLAAPWGMRLIAYSPRANPAQAAELGVTLVPTLQEVFRESDYVSLHCRLEPSTHGLIGEREFRAMKPTAYFINVARGEIVQQNVLVQALRERWFAAAGLDVFENEPLPADDPLLSLSNVILTPHWLPATLDAAKRTMTEISTGLVRVSQGLVPDNVLNKAVLDRPGFRAKLAKLSVNAGSKQARTT
jgi:phosphoglycerate dehydrogenase-like enzyme